MVRRVSEGVTVNAENLAKEGSLALPVLLVLQMDPKEKTVKRALPDPKVPEDIEVIRENPENPENADSKVQ